MRKIVENDKTTAEDMRTQALERMAQTAKRKKGGYESEAPKKKSRRSTADAVEYLKERAAKEIALKEQELELRKKEQENLMAREKEKNKNQENYFDLHYASTTTAAATNNDGLVKSTAATVAIALL